MSDTRRCAVCEAELPLDAHRLTKYCSPKCLATARSSMPSHKAYLAKKRAETKARWIDHTCPVCGDQFLGPGKRVYCSQRCNMRGSTVAARQRDPERYREYRRKREARAYANPSVPQTCTGCGVEFMASRNRNRDRFCTPQCRYSYHGARLAELRTVERSCSWCGATYSKSTAKYCSDDCRSIVMESHRRRQRGALLAAWEDGDYEAVIAEVKSRSTIDATGCWIWPGKGYSGKKGGERYPYVQLGRQRKQVHRLVLEAKLGRLLGSQSAHHTCAVPMCCNPDHLQPATHAENILEMLQRHSYLARIRELESALGEAAPGHPLLDLIPCR